MTVWNLASPNLSPHRTAVKSEWCELLSSWTEENKSWLSTIGLGKAPKLSSKYVTFFSSFGILAKVHQYAEVPQMSIDLSQGTLFGSRNAVLSAAIWRYLKSAGDEMESKSSERRLQTSDRVCLRHFEI